MAALAFYDAVLQSGADFTHEEIKQGWPEKMFVWRVAQFQRPSTDTGVAARSAKLAMHYALSDAVVAGVVPCVRQVIRLEFSGKKRDIRGNAYGESSAAPIHSDVSEALVAAADVVQWLKSIEEQPSRFIAAWHAATTPGADAIPAPAPAPAGKVPHKAQSPDWTGEALAKKRATLTGRDATQQLVQITGLPAREITRREKQARDDAAQASQAGKRNPGKAA